LCKQASCKTPAIVTGEDLSKKKIVTGEDHGLFQFKNGIPGIAFHSFTFPTLEPNQMHDMTTSQ
jgi:hypothetical protein